MNYTVNMMFLPNSPSLRTLFILIPKENQITLWWFHFLGLSMETDLPLPILRYNSYLKRNLEMYQATVFHL